MGIEFDFKAGRTDKAESGERPSPSAETRERPSDPHPAPRAETDAGNAPAREEKKHTAPDMGQSINIPTIPELNVPVKKRKPRQKKEENTEIKELEKNLTIIIQMVYSLSATALNSPIFEISPEDAEKISAPLSRIFDRMDLSETMNKYGDGFALVMALIIVTAPRIMAYTATKPKKITKAGNTNEQTTEIPSSNREANNNDISDYTANVSSINKAALNFGF